MEKLRKPFLTQPNQRVPTVAVNVGPINISTVAPQTSQHSTNVPTVRGKSMNIQHQQLQTSQSTLSPVLNPVQGPRQDLWAGAQVLITAPPITAVLAVRGNTASIATLANASASSCRLQLLFLRAAGSLLAGQLILSL